MTEQNNALKKKKTDKKYIIALFVYVFILLFASSKMSPLFFTNEWADVNIYFNVAKAMVEGKTLYLETFDHKGPLIFFIYALGYIISSDSFFGMFLIELAAWCVMIYAVFRTSRLYLKRSASFIVSILFPLFLVKQMKTGGSAEEFILVFQTISFYFFVKYFKHKDASVHSPLAMFVHGLMVSMVLFIKINLILFWFFPLAGIFLNILINKEFKNFILNSLAFVAGIAVVALPICMYLYTHGALFEAYDVYITLNRKYAELGTFGSTITTLLQRIIFLYIEPLALFAMPIFGIFYFPIKLIQNRIGKVSLILSGFALYGAIFMSPTFQYYYPIPFLIFCLPALIGVSMLIKRRLEFTESNKVLFVLAFLALYMGLSQKSLNDTRVEAAFRKKDANYLTEELTNEIKKTPNPTLLNLGFGLGNNLFTTCNIVPTVKYFVTPNLSHDIYPQLRDEQEGYIKKREVEFVLVPQHYQRVRSNPDKPRTISNLDYFRALPAFHRNYQIVMVDTIVNTIDENSYETYALYKKRPVPLADSIKLDFPKLCSVK